MLNELYMFLNDIPLLKNYFLINTQLKNIIQISFRKTLLMQQRISLESEIDKIKY